MKDEASGRPPADDPPPGGEPAIAVRTRQPVGQGLEKAIDVVAWTLLVVGGLALLVLGFVASGDAGPAGFLVVLNPAVVVVVVFLVLRALAEILRLLKSAAGLPYSGTISGSRTVPELRCGRCRNVLHDADRCDACGASIERVVDVADLRGDGGDGGDGGGAAGDDGGRRGGDADRAAG